MLSRISIIGGHDKNGQAEPVRRLDIGAGEMLAVVGPTGSGKTQLISDIEQYADGETQTGRVVLMDDVPAAEMAEDRNRRHLVAEVSQKMNFVMDVPVAAFLERHAQVRGIENAEKAVRDVVALANELTGEPVLAGDNLTMLSGGQARALMVADVALISNAPVVLIDEIENAGIDRLKALEILAGQGKIVLVVTHDPTLMFMAGRRVVMKNGGMSSLIETGPEEKRILDRLTAIEKDISRLRNYVRGGGSFEQTGFNMEKKELWQEFYCIAR